ncbi:hypothetical protein OG788_46570 [Streptomyces sp. NBC_00647]|uniref:hypothetical protein n=1 Tax=Streptomyces sp. NBC_00647 TaxID=2975796 RepID=UPI00324A15BA
MRWEHTAQQTQGRNVTSNAERDAEHALTATGVVLLRSPPTGTTAARSKPN